MEQQLLDGSRTGHLVVAEETGADLEQRWYRACSFAEWPFVVVTESGRDARVNADLISCPFGALNEEDKCDLEAAILNARPRAGSRYGWGGMIAYANRVPRRRAGRLAKRMSEIMARAAIRDASPECPPCPPTPGDLFEVAGPDPMDAARVQQADRAREDLEARYRERFPGWELLERDPCMSGLFGQPCRRNGPQAGPCACSQQTALFDHTRLWRDEHGERVLTLEPYSTFSRTAFLETVALAIDGDLSMEFSDDSPWNPGSTEVILLRRSGQRPAGVAPDDLHGLLTHRNDAVRQWAFGRLARLRDERAQAGTGTVAGDSTE